MRLRRDLLININLLLLATIAGAVVLIILWRVLTVIFPVLALLLAAMLLAFLLGSFVARLELSGVPRALAVFTVYILLLALIFSLSTLFLAPLAQQIGALTAHLPADMNQLRHAIARVDLFLEHHSIPIRLESWERQGLSYLQRAGKELLGSTLTIVLAVSQVVIGVVVTIVLSLYLLIDGPRLRHNILRLIPEPTRGRVLFGEAAIRTVVGGYIRGQLVLAITIGLMAAAGSWLLGVHYPLVIGLVAGFFELVPMLGPVMGAIPAIMIALFQSWKLAVAVVILFVIIQQLESQVIAPRVMGHAVGVHPIVALLAVLLGADLDGMLGALVAVPVAGVAYVLAQAIYSQVTGQHQVITVTRQPPFYVEWLRRLHNRLVQREMRPHGGTVRVTIEAPSEQLAEIARERDALAAQFQRVERAEQPDEGSVRE